MGKRAELLIHESAKELQNLKNRQKTLTKQKRIIALQRIQKDLGETRQQLADHLVVHIRTLERWISKYKSGGIEELLDVKARRTGSKIITPEMHAGLEERAFDPKNSFKGYWDAQNWLQATYGVEVKYQRVREYMIKHFGTKVKSPRKSHINKDEGAVALFKNAKNENKTYNGKQ